MDISSFHSITDGKNSLIWLKRRKKVVSVTCIDGFIVVISRNMPRSADLFTPEESEIEVFVA